VAAGYPGELRLQLCRVKNNDLAGGIKDIANAGALLQLIFLERLLTLWQASS
jgi:hypothetical protein